MTGKKTKKDYEYQKLTITELRDVIQDCNINFLIGAGLSMPYIPLLGSIETILTQLSQAKGSINNIQEKIIRASLYKNIFSNAILKNTKILLKTQNTENLELVLNNYKEFLRIINAIILNRRSTILNKQVNIFTTNFDIFFEKAMEEINVEYNDGFSGSFNPTFNLSNFKKSIFKRSLHYDNIHEMPVFNLVKLHGSLTWKKKLNENNITFDKDLSIINDVKLPNDKLIDIQVIKKDKSQSKDILKSMIDKSKGKKLSKSIKKFIKDYEKISIINPIKEKFKETVLNRNYYELLRMYSSELEKENTILFVMGFSFSDEHIREVTLRAANSNPTLKVYIFAHDKNANQDINDKIIHSNVKNKNIQIIPKMIDYESKRRIVDFSALNKKVFEELLRDINGSR